MDALATPAAAPARPGNTLGRMTAVTLFTPVRRRWAPILTLALFGGKYIPLARRHILQFDFIKHVRWAIVRGLPGERLNYPYLFFESNFDGPWQNYIDAFAYVIPHDIRLVWGRGPAFPAPPPSEPLKAWIAANSLEGGTYYCAHPEASTKMIKGALRVKEELDALVAAGAQLGPEAFRDAYERMLAEVQAHL